MKILIITPYSPYPANSGGRMRIWQELQFLAARHEVTLVAFYQTEQEWNARETLGALCRTILVKRPQQPRDSDLAALRRVEDLFQWYTTPEMERALHSLQNESFDLMVLHHIFVAQYASWFDAPAVLEEQNIESEIFRQHAQAPGLSHAERAFRHTRWLLLRNYETALWKQFPLRIAVSAHDQHEIELRCSVGRTIVIENGIDTREIEMLPPAARRTLLFMGSLDFYANIDAVMYLHDAILPLLWQHDPTLELVIAGRRPPRLLLALAQDPRIRVIGDPADMTAIARACALTVAPLRLGSGTRIKILHSMALGRPVVTTPRGAEGLAVRDGCELLVREEPQAFADAVLELLNNPALAERLRCAGRQLVETHYDWTLLLETYERELTTLVNAQ